MEKKQVAVGDPVIISGLTITPVIRTLAYSWQDKTGGALFYLKEPLYILISIEKSPAKVFNIDGTETTLEEITAKFPELQTAFNIP